MPETLVEKLHSDLCGEKDVTSKSNIVFFERNALIIKNLSFEDKHDLSLYLEFIWKYTNSLVDAHRYSDAISNSLQILKMIDINIERFNCPELRDDFYYIILFDQGRAHYYLNQYDKALKNFEILVKHDPKNELFKKWLVYSKNKENRWIINTIYIIGAIILNFTTFFGRYLHSGSLRLYLSIFGFSTLLFALFFDVYNRRNFKINK